MGDAAPTSIPTVAAQVVPLQAARLVLFWPLALRKQRSLGGADEVAAAVLKQANTLRDDPSANWHVVNDPLHHIAPLEQPDDSVKWNSEAYGEVLYFHEFVQSFLYELPDNDQTKPFFLFRRTDVKRADFDIAGTLWTMQVERLNLYLFRTGGAVLVTELYCSDCTGKTLADFQTLHDYARRLYAPFVGINQSQPTPCFMIPQAVTWCDAQDKPLYSWKNDESLKDVAALVARPAGGKGQRNPPLFSYWQWLLGGALPLEPQDNAPYWRPISDERMPSMATVQLAASEDYQRLREGDIMRLAFADSAGADNYSYDPEFLQKNFWQDHAYTRFKSLGTLYLFSSYCMVALGSGDFFLEHIGTHMRRHYFQMGLLLQLEKVSLLSFSAQISQAVVRHGQAKDRQAFNREMTGIEEQFLHFTHRFRFTGVSSQLQGEEMFALWRKRMGLKALYDDVREELHTANEFLNALEQSSQTRAANSLSQVATVGLAVGLAVGALGMNVTIEEGLLKQVFSPHLWSNDLMSSLSKPLEIVFLTLLMTFGTTWLLTLIISSKRVRSWPDSRATKFMLAFGFVLSSMIFVALACAYGLP